MPSQASVIRQAAAPAASKTRVAGEKPTCRHAVARDVEHGPRRAVERVVLAPCRHGRDGARWRASPWSPSRCRRAGSDGRAARGRGLQEEFLHPRLPVRQPVAEEGEIAANRGSGAHREVRGRIERVVDRHARRRAEATIGIHHRRAAAIGEHQVDTAASARRSGWSGSARISASVAGASTSQKMRSAPGRACATMPSSSSRSNTPTPLALTTMSAVAGLGQRRRASPPPSPDRRPTRAHGGGSMSRCCCRSKASGS